MDTHKIVSREEWTTARKALLAKEKELLRASDALAAERRQLPWVRIDKSYVFDGPTGKETLADLFAGRSQLLVQHFMMGPDWEEGCPGCSFGADGLSGSVVHLINHDVMVVAISRAPLPRIQAFQKRMGWTSKWVSSFGCDFNFDFNVPFTEADKARGKAYYNYEIRDYMSDELPSYSTFLKDEAGRYSTPIRPLPAAPSGWAAPSARSTSCPRAATSRPGPTSAAGSATMTSMRISRAIPGAIPEADC